MSIQKLTGRCLCGTVSYEITGGLGPIYNCHCSKCRRWHGSAYRTRAAVETKNFKWTSGEEYVKEYLREGEATSKTYCDICGSSLISRIVNDPEYIGLPIGGLEQDPGNRPVAHIFVGSKAPWYEITDDLPQYAEWPPGGRGVVRQAPAK